MTDPMHPSLAELLQTIGSLQEALSAVMPCAANKLGRAAQAELDQVSQRLAAGDADHQALEKVKAEQAAKGKRARRKGAARKDQIHA